MEKLTSVVRRCIEDYNMIKKSGKIAVGLSGGKDSLVLLCALASLRGYYPVPFELYGITADTGFSGMDFSSVAELCRRLEVPYIIKKTDIKDVVFDKRNEKNPCSLCSRMRRGVLSDTLAELGIPTIALGHHKNDAVETFFLSLTREGRINCFMPVTYLDRSGITQIRPLLYLGEKEIERVVKKYSLPVVKSTCPVNDSGKRRETRIIIDELKKSVPDIEIKIFGALKRGIWNRRKE